MSNSITSEDTEGGTNSNNAGSRKNNNSCEAGKSEMAPNGQSTCETQTARCRFPGKKAPFEIATKIIEIAIAAFVGLALVCVGYLQYRVYSRQAGIMKQQAKISAADLRAWVYEDSSLEFLTPLNAFPEAFRRLAITIRFHVKNIGKSPALKIAIPVKLELLGLHPDLLSEQRHFCIEAPPSSAFVAYGKIVEIEHTIFPNQELAFDVTAVLKGEDIAEYQAKPSGPNSGPVKSDILVLMGCINYRSGEEVHHTGFIYNLYRKDPAIERTYIAIDFEGPAVEIKDLWKKPNELGMGWVD